MLVVDIEADPKGALAAAVLPETVVMVYNSAIDSTEDVVSKIEAALKANGGTPLTRIAFANHAGEVWQLASDCICHPGQDGCITDASPVISALAKGLAKEGGRIDLLGCRLLTLDPHLPDKLEKEFEGIQFTASDDDTGNRSAGGDWVQESDGIDITADYFDPVQLKLYTDTLLYVPPWAAGAMLRNQPGGAMWSPSTLPPAILVDSTQFSQPVYAP